MTQWSTLFLPSAEAEAVTDALRTALVPPHYAPYDPFSLIPGDAYARAVKAFVAPAQGGWTRAIVAPEAALPDALLSALSRLEPLLWLALDGESARITAYVNGAAADPAVAFADHLRVPPERFAAYLRAEDLPASDAKTAAPGGIPREALPDNVQQMADTLGERGMNRLFRRMTRSVGGDQRQAAADLIRSRTADWASLGGRQIRALLASLTLPESTDWREPDYVALRDAYRLHQRRQRRPDASLRPGDAEAMQAVPDALDYTPIFAGVVDTEAQS